MHMYTGPCGQTPKVDQNQQNISHAPLEADGMITASNINLGALLPANLQGVYRTNDACFFVHAHAHLLGSSDNIIEI